MILDPVVGILIMASAAVLFASAAVHKLRDLKRFDEIFSAYGMIPANSPLRISWAVPLAELGVAAGLAGSVTRPYAAALGILLLLSYAAAIAVNLGADAAISPAAAAARMSGGRLRPGWCGEIS